MKWKRQGFDPWVGKVSWRRAWQPTLVFMPEESHDRGAWWSTAHRVAKSQTWLYMHHMQLHMMTLTWHELLHPLQDTFYHLHIDIRYYSQILNNTCILGIYSVITVLLYFSIYFAWFYFLKFGCKHFHIYICKIYACINALFCTAIVIFLLLFKLYKLNKVN